MAKENPGWGYFRIRGELLKLGHAVAATTIRSVLLGAGIPPSGRRAGLTWKQLLTAHAQTLVAADFLSVDTVFFKRLYVLSYTDSAVSFSGGRQAHELSHVRHMRPPGCVGSDPRP